MQKQVISNGVRARSPFSVKGHRMRCLCTEIASKAPVIRLLLLCKRLLGVNRGSVFTYTPNQAQIEDHIDIRQER